MIISKNCIDVKVVVSENATQTELFAAGELIKYIKKMTGAELSLCKDVYFEGTKQIIIGGPLKNKAAAQWISFEKFKKEVPGPEGMMIKSFGVDCILIAGSEDSNERGTVYGVYEFLERFLGCSLAAFTHPGTVAGEYVPSVNKIEIGEIFYLKNVRQDLFVAHVCSTVHGQETVSTDSIMLFLIGLLKIVIIIFIHGQACMKK